jgi:pimeloyl-ACP methyl ester carboxylesterase
MTIVLVHGNPETEAIWDDLVPHLRSDDVVRLSPPGFGSAIPPGFDCSTDAYREWLASELGKLTQPIDLVGHDWGGGARHTDRNGVSRSDTILDERYFGVLRRGLRLARHGAGLADGERRRAGGCADGKDAGRGPSTAVRELGHDHSDCSESSCRCEQGLGPGNTGGVQIGRSTSDARSRSRVATGSRQAWPGADRDRRSLRRRGDTRATFCPARQRRGRRFERGGSLVDVPAAEARC